MICAVCKKNRATQHKFVPGFKEPIPICSACRAKYAPKKFPHDFFDLNDDFDPDTIFTDFFTETKSGVPSLICPNCGFEFDNYFAEGRLGCSKCYDIFKEQITPVIAKIHGCTHHNGSRPHKSSEVT